ncbi:hypothetical protein EYF80_044177 [Liparis tanakae]|uniref:Uncharacterized protein n=1 Tax=Liparis tanakae TaxID=230148 RepID=A0A4Z2FXC8_9TELE|nr:hypothetical protein EYF80_044177 [Liparis tanakae]
MNVSLGRVSELKVYISSPELFTCRATDWPLGLSVMKPDVSLVIVSFRVVALPREKIYDSYYKARPEWDRYPGVLTGFSHELEQENNTTVRKMDDK